MNALVIQVPERPGIFLLVFALVSATLLPAWEAVGPVYGHGLTWLVRIGCTVLGLPVSLGAMSLDFEAINPGLVAGVALFCATPNRTVQWKLRWVGILILVLVSAQAVLLVAQVQAVVSGLALEEHSLRPWLAVEPIGHEESVVSRSLQGAWYWLSPLMTAGVWLTAGLGWRDRQ